MRIAAVIPCHNEAYTIQSIVEETLQYVNSVVVADDNSVDGTELKAQVAGAKVIRNNGLHRGVGANTKRGLKAIDADIVITLDGDGQHLASEIPHILAPLLEGGADLVIGSRFMSDNEMPRYRRFGNDIITWLYNFGRKTKVMDTQSCFRAYSRKLLESIDIEERGFGFSTEVLIKTRAKGFKIFETPISCVYHDNYARNSSMNPIMHGLRVALVTIKWRLKIELLRRG